MKIRHRHPPVPTYGQLMQGRKLSATEKDECDRSIARVDLLKESLLVALVAALVLATIIWI